MHKRKYAPTDPGGSRMVSGRYNRGLDRFPEDRVSPALYLATSPEICLGEMYRHVTPKLLPSLNDYRLSELTVRLQAVVDCRDPGLLGLSFEDLVHDTKLESTQGIGAAAHSPGAWKASSRSRRRASATTSSCSQPTSGSALGSRLSRAAIPDSTSSVPDPLITFEHPARTPDPVGRRFGWPQV